MLAPAGIPRRRGARELPVICIGAGIGGLCAALHLLLRGRPVILLEAAAEVGGKAGRTTLGQQGFDTGPTVLTMPWVFERLFAAAGSHFYDALRPQALPVLAQHFFAGGECLALHADAAASQDAMGRFAGRRAAAQYGAFAAYAKELYEVALAPFIDHPKPSLGGIWREHGLRSLALFNRLDARRSVMRALGQMFDDSRLQRLFGRYATYSGGSPYKTPATYNLVAHVEAQGVYRLAGGMARLAEALAALVGQHGGALRLNTEALALHQRPAGGLTVQLAGGESLAASAVVLNGGPATLARLWQPAPAPPRRPPVALSAVTLSLIARLRRCDGAPAPLAYHNVCFAGDYREEFAAIFARRQICAAPTVYLQAADRHLPGVDREPLQDRLFCLINAPSVTPAQAEPEANACLIKVQAQLRRCGLILETPTASRSMLPADFARRYPGSHGAIYGAPPHSMFNSLWRAGSRSPIPGVYYCGGSVHPGPGVPMTALSGQWAAQAVDTDHRSTARSLPVATPGGTSTPKATTAAMP